MDILNNNFNEVTLFCTSQCNNRCIMCCQPPESKNDIEYFYNHNLKKIHKIPQNIDSICITGGEPTLLGTKLISLIQEIRKTLSVNPEIIILSNGRKFSSLDFAKEFGELEDNNLFVNIELHSDYYKDHDLISGAKNSFAETLRGIYNLATYEVNIELRIIICKQNYKRLVEIASFIHKNLPFVARTIFMGMECIGYAYENLKTVWIEPSEYKEQLIKAVLTLSRLGHQVNIYNIPLCLLSEELYSFASRSISKWKVKYVEACEECSMRLQCCGLFSTSRIQYNHIKPI